MSFEIKKKTFLQSLLFGFLGVVIFFSFIFFYVQNSKNSSPLESNFRVKIHSAEILNCDLNSEACEGQVKEYPDVKFRISMNPRPILINRPLQMQLDWTDPQGRLGKPTHIDLKGLEMDMGFLRPELFFKNSLSDKSQAHYEAQFQLPVCTTPQMHWKGTLLLEKKKDEELEGIEFEFLSSKPVQNLRAAPLGGDFELESSAGKRRLNDFLGSVVLLYFGFTSCPDVCPTTLMDVAEAFRGLSTGELGSVKLLFVTVDPERDTLERLSGYLGHFHPNMIPLSGEKESIRKVADLYGATFTKVPLDSGMSYTMDHTAQMFLINKSGHWVMTLPYGVGSKEIKEAIQFQLKEGE